MGSRYKIKVIKPIGTVNVYPTPGNIQSPIGHRTKGETFISDQNEKYGGVVYYKEEGTSKWTPKSSGTFTNLAIMTPPLSSTSSSTSTANKPTPKPTPKVTKPAKKSTPKKPVKTDKGDDKPKERKISNSNTRVKGTSGNLVSVKGSNDLNKNKSMGIPVQGSLDVKGNVTKDGSVIASGKVDRVSLDDNIDKNLDKYDKMIKNSANRQNIVHANFELRSNGTYKEAERFFKVTEIGYPNVTKETNGGYVADYNFTISDSIKESIAVIKENLNVPSSYSRNIVNQFTHTKFNRFRMEFPDLYLRNSMSVIFFTRPDLNLFKSGSSILTQIKNEPRDYYIIVQNRDIGRLLTENGGEYDEYQHHNFNPLLSNMAQSLEIQDDSVDTVDMGETFTGYKMQYAKHNIKSITAGQLSIKFKETFNLAVTNMHQLWVDYQSNVYKGVFRPKDKHIWAKELDYACNIYYFLLDQDGETIRFWSKYYGCFPVNVPKSSFSFDSGSQVSFPELSVTYNYIYKSDLSPRTLVEFNHDGGDNNLSYEYLPTYAGQYKDHSGSTWAGIPYVQSFRYDSGISNLNGGRVMGLKLRYRESTGGKDNGK